MVALQQYAGFAILALGYLIVLGLTTRCEQRYQENPNRYRGRCV